MKFATLYLIFASLMQPLMASAANTGKESRFLKAEKLLASSASLCSGHLSGEPKKPKKRRPYIIWEAHGLPDAPDSITRRFARVLGGAPELLADGCRKWRFSQGHTKGDFSMKIIEVCPLSVKGPWSSCSPIPATVQSVVLTSTLVSDE